MLADLRGGVIDAVVAWHLDRLHRQPKELEEFFEVVDQAGDAQLASVTGDVDLATHDGRFTARILGAVSHKESGDKSRRIQRQKQDEAAAGKPNRGGSRPFGYERDHVSVREAEAVVIRELAKRFLAGESVRSLCVDLNARGVATSTGGTWSEQPLRRMLRSGRISGQREHKRELVADAQWPAIITPSQTAQIRARMDDPERRTTNGTARRYLLTGLLRCGVCEEELVARPRLRPRSPSTAPVRHCLATHRRVSPALVTAAPRRGSLSVVSRYSGEYAERRGEEATRDVIGGPGGVPDLRGFSRCCPCRHDICRYLGWHSLGRVRSTLMRGCGGRHG